MIKIQSPKTHTLNHNGQTLVLALLILGSMLVVGLALGGFAVKELGMSSGIHQSVRAYYAAEAGVERALYEIRNETGPIYDNPGVPQTENLDNGTSFEVMWDGSTKVKSEGTFATTKRAIEIEFGGSGENGGNGENGENGENGDPTHKECVGVSCEDVPGAGADLCTDDADCIGPSHKECVGVSCEDVPGAGADLCTDDSDCGGAGVCVEGAGSDDPACGIISCDDWHHIVGEASPTETNYCYDSPDITTARCEGIGDCKDADTEDCGSEDDTQELACGECCYVDGCTETTDGFCNYYPSSTTMSEADYYYHTGAKSPAETQYCYARAYYCTGFSCAKTYGDTLIYTCKLCKYIEDADCDGNVEGSCTNYSDGTDCGEGRTCVGGVCQ